MSKSPPGITLSIIISAHHEGIILHKTLRSVARATAPLVKAAIPFEVLVTVDNGDEETERYLHRQTVIENLNIFRASFGDLGEARNFGIAKAKGQYIATLDADDLVSENWFVDGVKLLKEKGESLILHTEWSINFGTQDIAWHKYNSLSKAEDAIIMTWANRWDSAIITSRDILKKFPYSSNSNGFGSEDWHFNSQTIAAGLSHITVPQSVLFVRRKDVSEMTIQKADYRTVHYTDLLDLEYFKNIDVDQFKEKSLHFSQRRQQPQLRNPLTYIKPILKRGYALAYAISPLQRPLRLAKKLTKRTLKKPVSRFPAWLITEWRSIHTIEKGLFPSQSLLQTIPVYQSEIYDLGLAYQEVSTYFSQLPDYLIAVPHLVPGGADLVILNYVRALRDLHPTLKITLISTDNTESPWAKRLPADVDFVPYGQICARRNLPHELQLQLFARLFIQTKCHTLHVIQSALAFEFAAKYKSLLLKNPYKIYACAFCEDIDNEGRFVGHIHSGLPNAYPVLSHVFTDNQAVIDQLVHEYGYDKNKFTVHYQPVEIQPVKTIPKKVASTPYKVLWASRLVSQKRPDIARSIAKKMDHNRFSIDVYGNGDGSYPSTYFDGVSGIHYKGGFNGLESLPIEQYDAFIYTSANDGVPNILLGIAALGLPIIAPDQGGISEVVNQNTGLLISDLNDIDAYVDALNYLFEHSDKAHSFALEAHSLVEQRHSYDHFKNDVRNIEIEKYS